MSSVGKGGAGQQDLSFTKNDFSSREEKASDTFDQRTGQRMPKPHSQPDKDLVSDFQKSLLSAQEDMPEEKSQASEAIPLTLEQEAEPFASVQPQPNPFEETSAIAAVSVASLSQFGLMNTPPPAPSPASTAAAQAQGSSREAFIAFILDRVEQAIKNEIAPVPGAPISFRVPLDPQMGKMVNVEAVDISFSPHTIDISILQLAAGSSPELALAIQAFTERLQTKFPNRQVRVKASQSGTSSLQSDAPGFTHLSDLFTQTRRAP